MDSGAGSLDFSVVMAAHRADEFLVQAIRSVEQALEGHAAELIVVANGAAREQVAALALQTRCLAGTRVELAALDSLVYSVNKGIELARGCYIARMDADDLCLPDRFTRQLELARASGADFCFAAVEVIDAAGQPTGECRSSSAQLWLRCGPIQPTAFIRRAALLQLGGYGNLEYSEDYHLWLRARLNGRRFAIGAEPATRYRIHAGQNTASRRLADTFATDLGIKLMLGLRAGHGRLVGAATVDLLRLCYRKCRNAFS